MLKSLFLRNVIRMIEALLFWLTIPSTDGVIDVDSIVVGEKVVGPVVRSTDMSGLVTSVAAVGL